MLRGLRSLSHLLLAAVDHDLRLGRRAGKAPMLSLRHRLTRRVTLLLRGTSRRSVGHLLAMGRIIMAVYRALVGQMCSGYERALSRSRIELVRPGGHLVRDLLLRYSGARELSALRQRRGSRLLVSRGNAVGVGGVILDGAVVAAQDRIDAEGRCATDRRQPYERRLALRGFGAGL